jgi:hypothetical protein
MSTTTTTLARRSARTNSSERQILDRITRGLLIDERELRYQLDRKDNHPLAHAAELLDVLADLEQRGLVQSELCFRLTSEGRARLAELGACEQVWR